MFYLLSYVLLKIMNFPHTCTCTALCCLRKINTKVILQRQHFCATWKIVQSIWNHFPNNWPQSQFSQHMQVARWLGKLFIICTLSTRSRCMPSQLVAFPQIVSRKLTFKSNSHELAKFFKEKTCFSHGNWLRKRHTTYKICSLIGFVSPLLKALRTFFIYTFEFIVIFRAKLNFFNS